MMITFCLTALYHKRSKLGINWKAVPTAFWNMALCGLLKLHGRFVWFGKFSRTFHNNLLFPSSVCMIRYLCIGT